MRPRLISQDNRPTRLYFDQAGKQRRRLISAAMSFQRLEISISRTKTARRVDCRHPLNSATTCAEIFSASPTRRLQII